jgi:hypothetical protein
MIADVPITDSLGKSYGAFDGWGMVAVEVEVLLEVGGLDADRDAEVQLVNMHVKSRKVTRGGVMV